MKSGRDIKYYLTKVNLLIRVSFKFLCLFLAFYVMKYFSKHWKSSNWYEAEAKMNFAVT